MHFREVIRVAHLASFEGNFGDYISHFGFNKWFADLLGKRIKWHRIEIREMYRGKRRFDDGFINEVNQSDILVIGGGNFLELWPENSRTGCSIDLPPEILKTIRVPIFFNSLGLDVGRGISSNAKKNFEHFVEFILTSKSMLLSLRNDGARTNLMENFRKFQNTSIVDLPDHGFFTGIKPAKKRRKTRLNIGLSLASDMPLIRFPNGIDTFSRELSEVLQNVHFDHLFIFCHTILDFDLASSFTLRFQDSIRRHKLTIVQSGPLKSDQTQMMRVYARDIDLMIAMRFHGSVLPISLAIPTIGLATYPQINLLYQDLGYMENLVDVSRITWTEKLYDLVERKQVLSNEEVLQLQKIGSQLLDRRLVASSSVKKWLFKQLIS